jgi:hypothetical protein
MKKTLTLLSFLLPVFLFAQNGDCPGEWVCTNQTENMISGSTNEINAANRGCLSANEATSSYWYQICAAANGTISFTIDPSGANNDYDFAVWGPGSPCPPTTAPLRCSYAATPVGGGPSGDQTGLGNGATDNSEGAGGNGWVAPITATAGQCFVVCVSNYGGGSSTFNIAWGGTAGLSCAVLPVEITSFTCHSAVDGITLDWECASETDNAYFAVERTTNGVDYVEVGRVDGAGTSTQATRYTFTDVTAPAGTSYYRLVQVDVNGRTEKYGPISCDYIPDGEAVIYISNMAGQVVYTGYTNDYKQTVREARLPEGVYIIELVRGNTRLVLKQAITEENR